MRQDLFFLFDEDHIKGHRINYVSSHAVYAYHSDFCERLRISIEAYSVLGARVTSVSGQKQLLLLSYSHAILEEYTDLVYHLQTSYARNKEHLSDPRRATLTIPMLAEITRDICFYEEVKERAAELAGAVDALVESLKILLMDTNSYCDFQCLAVELQSTCADLKRTMATLSTTLENRLRLFELSRGMHEAENVRLLSILATIFLPLSLACGLLSMQTRFSNLHYLLYDFFGVLVLLGTTVAVILTLIRSYIWLKEVLAQLERRWEYTRLIMPTANIIVLWCLVLGWGLLFSSFLVGMIKDVRLGLKILGYGVAAAIGTGLLILFILVGAFFMLFLL